MPGLIKGLPGLPAPICRWSLPGVTQLVERVWGLLFVRRRQPHEGLLPPTSAGRRTAPTSPAAAADAFLCSFPFLFRVAGP